MKHVHLSHDYHDAALFSVRFSEGDLTFVANLDGHWNNNVAETTYWIFHNVKYLEETRLREDESKLR